MAATAMMPAADPNLEAPAEAGAVKLKLTNVSKSFANAAIPMAALQPIDVEIRSGEVNVGTTVRLKDMGSNKTVEYHIVGSAEADPAELKLSNESPVGKAIMGHKKGDVVEVAAPRGALKFKIMEIKAA